MKILDVGHSVSGRIKKGGSPLHTHRDHAETLPFNTPASITIADLIDDVKSTHRSILSQNVLEHFNEERPKDGYVALDLTPKRGGVLVNDMSLVTSTYGKSDSGIANNIFGDSQNSPEEILYISSDIKRTKAVVRPLGVQFPSGNLKLGSVGSITYNADSVNIVGKTIYELTGTNDPNAEKRAGAQSVKNCKLLY